MTMIPKMGLTIHMCSQVLLVGKGDDGGLNAGVGVSFCPGDVVAGDVKVTDDPAAQCKDENFNPRTLGVAKARFKFHAVPV